jgi:hypothetical protein
LAIFGGFMRLPAKIPFYVNIEDYCRFPRLMIKKYKTKTCPVGGGHEMLHPLEMHEDLCQGNGQMLRISYMDFSREPRLWPKP